MLHPLKQLLLLLLFALTIISCNDNASTSDMAKSDSLHQSVNTGAEEKQKPDGAVPGALRAIHLSMKADSKIDRQYSKSTVDSVFVIANAVFNSDEFQKKIAVLDFKYSSYCLGRTSCKKNEKNIGQRIPGATILADLFREKEVAITYRLEPNGDALGRACPGDYDIISFYNNIMEDMEGDSIPPAYKLAVNLCHEYMHQVGYCHIYGKLIEINGQPDSRYINDDVTYRVGWEAFYLLERWYRGGTLIKGL